MKHRFGLTSGVVILMCWLLSGAVAQDSFPEQHGTLWAPYLEWSVTNASFEGNPFDLEAWVTFTHDQSGDTHTTPMFYAGEDVWRFRFSGTRTGVWRFRTRSSDRDLDALTGQVVIEVNPAPGIKGFLTTHGHKFAVQTGDDGVLEGQLYNIYMNHGLAELLGDLSRDDDQFRQDVARLLDEVEAHGMNALFLVVLHDWLELGTRAYTEHDSENPDLRTFTRLEHIITEAHRRSLGVHLWKWGDEERQSTPVGLDGGINGEVDRRLQRYIAARLGPLPGWTMAYGFDLEEWATPDEVRAWAEYMHAHMGWPHLLTAREHGQHRGRTFELGQDKLDIYSVDDRPTGETPGEFYDVAVARLDAFNMPVLFERRFVHTRDGVWDQDTTRRALWQFTMAGGAAAVWGVMWNDGEPYPNPAVLRTHGEFWHGRFRLDLERMNDLSDAFVLGTPEHTHYVFYQEDTSTLTLDLSGMAGAQPIVAVDTRQDEYREIPLGTLEPQILTWQAPYASDWAIAVGEQGR